VHRNECGVSVERLRDERLNDILQARADPRRRAEEGFVETIYAAGSPYRRPSGGLPETVRNIDAAAVRTMHARRFDPARMTLIVGGVAMSTGLTGPTPSQAAPRAGQRQKRASEEADRCSRREPSRRAGRRTGASSRGPAAAVSEAGMGSFPAGARGRRPLHERQGSAAGAAAGVRRPRGPRAR